MLWAHTFMYFNAAVFRYRRKGFYIMDTKIEDISNTRKKIAVKFSADEVSQNKANALDEVCRGAKIDGFRPGKAPKAMVEKVYAKAVEERADRALASKAIDALNALKDVELYAVVNIDKSAVDGGEELVFTADVYPEVKLPDSLATHVELQSDAATDEEVDSAVEFHRNQRAKYEEVDREIQKGDFVRLAYTGTIDGKPVSEFVKAPIYADQKSTWEEAGNADAPGIQGVVQGILGMKKGEKKTLEHEFPAEFPDKEAAGKKALYDVEILEVRQKVLPPLDADFFKAFEVADEAAFRDKLRQSIASEKKSHNEIMKRQLAVDELMAKCDFPLPESAVDDERQAILEEMMTRFMSSGASREDIEKNKDAIVENASREAEGRAKMRIFLNRVAKANDLKVENEDMSRMLWQEAMRTRTKPEDLIKQLRNDPQRRNRLRSDALLQKAINFIADKAEVSVKQ